MTKVSVGVELSATLLGRGGPWRGSCTCAASWELYGELPRLGLVAGDGEVVCPSQLMRRISF